MRQRFCGRRTVKRDDRALWIVAPGKAELRTQILPEVGPGQALVKTRFTAISRGTESTVFHQQVPASEHLRMRAPYQEGDFPGPVKYGYINVGVVEEGPTEMVGREVFSLFPHQSHFVIPVDAIFALPADVPAERAVLAAGMETAINILWDAAVKVGDRVAVVGSGVIGSLCAYLAKQIPGVSVLIIDTNPERKRVAACFGCDFSLPESSDHDFDLVIHASGSEAGLQSALQLAGQEASVVEASWYGDRRISVSLGQAFHARRLQLLSSQVGTIPASQRGRWSYSRRLALALSLLRDPALECLISGESDFDNLPTTLARVASDSQVLCHRVRYP